MKEEDKLAMINHYRTKARHFLSQADEMMELKHWDLAVNRYYYACFHIVQSLFVCNGLSAHTHSGTLSQFTLHFVKTNLVPIDFGGFFSKMVQLRQKADYNNVANISEEEARSIVGMSHSFFEIVESLIGELGDNNV